MNYVPLRYQGFLRTIHNKKVQTSPFFPINANKKFLEAALETRDAIIELKTSLSPYPRKIKMPELTIEAFLQGMDFLQRGEFKCDFLRGDFEIGQKPLKYKIIASYPILFAKDPNNNWINEVGKNHLYFECPIYRRKPETDFKKAFGVSFSKHHKEHPKV